VTEIRELLPEDANAWNEVVAGSEQGNTFLRWEWLHLLHETDPTLHPLVLGVFDGADHLLGGQAVLYQERWGMRVTPDFEFFYSGPVIAPPRRSNLSRRVSDHNTILSELAAALAERVDVIEVEAHPNLDDARAFTYGPGWETELRYTHIWHMDDPDQVWGWMDRDKRRQIRKANETFCFGREEGDAVLDAFLPLYHQTMLKFSWRPSALWESTFRQRFAWMASRDQARLYTARTPEGELVAGVVVLVSRDDGTSYLWRQGSNPDTISTGVVSALYWYAGKGVADQTPHVNFGGSPLQSLSHFKDTLGATPTPHYALRYTSRPGRLRVLQGAQRLKDWAYNRIMPGTFGLWQRLRYGQAARDGDF